MRALKWFGWRALAASDVTGPSRHWMSNVAYTKKENAAPVGTGSGVWCWAGLLGDAIRAFPGGVLRRFDLLAALAAQDADEAAHRVRCQPVAFMISASVCAFGAFHHCDHFGLLVGAIHLRFLAIFLPTFFEALAFLGARASSWLRSPDSGTVVFSVSIAVEFIVFLLDRLRS